MTHDEFQIGVEFSCGGKRWRCTDVGSRVIVAICLEPHEVVEAERSTERGENLRERRYVSDDPSWLAGPPYAVAEYVFDEPSLEACSLLREGMGSDKPAVVG